MGCTMDLWSALPSLWFCVSDPNGEFICIPWGLLFKGSMLPMTVPPMGLSGSSCRGTTGNLSPVEEAFRWELSNIVIQDPLEDAPRMDHFRKCREEGSAEAPADTFCMDAALCEQELLEQACQSDLGGEGSKCSKESDSSESTPCHYSPRHHHSNSVS